MFEPCENELVTEDDFYGDAAGLALLSSRLHDWWFDADAIRWDAARSRVEIDIFTERPRAGKDTVPARLIIGNVMDWSLRDEAGIGWVDLSSLSCDDESSQITLRSNFPLSVEVAVLGVDVQLLVGNEVR
jgi:hypothetical protein